MKEFTEELRYEYPLNSESIVVDVGAYQGQFAREIVKRYNCEVICFEPLYDAFLRDIPTATVIPFALGAYSGRETFGVSNDSTGKFSEGPKILVPVLDVTIFLAMSPEKIDLIKLNCEGAEYEILDKLIYRPYLIRRLQNIQVQFHRVGQSYERKRNEIRSGLHKTHHLTYDCPFVWENWELNETARPDDA
jgi:FkbM family methyltransferase